MLQLFTIHRVYLQFFRYPIIFTVQPIFTRKVTTYILVTYPTFFRLDNKAVIECETSPSINT